MAIIAQLVTSKETDTWAAVLWSGKPEDGIEIAAFLNRKSSDMTFRYEFPLEADDGTVIFPAQLLAYRRHSDTYQAIRPGDYVLVNRAGDILCVAPDDLDERFAYKGWTSLQVSWEWLLDSATWSNLADEVDKASTVIKKVADAIKETRTNS